ncbi:ribosomal protein S18-alanine N-acetyltransferase [Nocardioides cavernaquae]|uniref:[Ribosomal protein bS18]-alanine N-acetyltransferase n=1 Tax=Nocardioides cavernaquae TaxID=2321396 RepID=A0A3A5HED0_9ACTN|nr:ribosomal protein S18-alanine N-acetyltransferase [Nocardioides cavernaquae]RJS46247.1 ribosomal-protein-alanine N-acetyltransferase [Nocardioides cavernaquae]
MIRPATAGDAAAIAGLEAALFGVDAWSAEQVSEELTGFGAGFILHAGEELAGYVVTRTIGDVSDLQRIAVDAAYQRGGRASALLREAMRAAAASGAERMLLEVAEDNEAALRFYAQRGFVEIDRRARYYRSGAAAIVMAADLFP